MRRRVHGGGRLARPVAGPDDLKSDCFARVLLRERSNRTPRDVASPRPAPFVWFRRCPCMRCAISWLLKRISVKWNHYGARQFSGVPIERAMDVIAQRGVQADAPLLLPVRQPPVP
jgi:hypothetical protein